MTATIRDAVSNAVLAEAAAAAREWDAMSDSPAPDCDCDEFCFGSRATCAMVRAERALERVAVLWARLHELGGALVRAARWPQIDGAAGAPLPVAYGHCESSDDDGVCHCGPRCRGDGEARADDALWMLGRMMRVTGRSAKRTGAQAALSRRQRAALWTFRAAETADLIATAGYHSRGLTLWRRRPRTPEQAWRWLRSGRRWGLRADVVEALAAAATIDDCVNSADSDRAWTAFVDMTRLPRGAR